MGTLEEGGVLQKIDLREGYDKNSVADAFRFLYLNILQVQGVLFLGEGELIKNNHVFGRITLRRHKINVEITSKESPSKG